MTTTLKEPTREHLRNALQLLDLGDVVGAARRIKLALADLPSGDDTQTPDEYICVHCRRQVTHAHHPFYPSCLKCAHERGLV